MRIVFHSRFPTDENNPRGGVESATCNLLHGLHHIGCDDLHMVTLEKGRQEVSVEQSSYATIHRLPASNWPMIIDIFGGPGRRRLKKYIASLDPDIVHFHETHGLAMSNLGFPSVFTLHGFDSENLPTTQSYAWRTRRIAWGLAERIGLARQRAMISIAPYVRDKIRRLTDATIYDICNAINKSGFEIERNEDPNMLFFAGWINRRKNALGLVEAFTEVVRRCPDARLELAGEFADEAYRHAVEQCISKNGLTNSVRLLGRISASEMRGKLSQAAIFVLPSFQENAPMVVAESMAAGVPVVTSNVCGMPDMIAHGETGYLVDPYDSGKLSDTIVGLLQSGELREEISRKCRESAKAQFHPEMVARRTVEVYERTIADY